MLESGVMLLFVRAKTVFPYEIQKILNPDLYGRSYGEIVPPGFLHNFTKNYRHDLNIGYIDVSRHLLQSAL
jgi:hypothetical protein